MKKKPAKENESLEGLEVVTETGDAFKAGMFAAGVQDVDGKKHPVIVLPEGSKVESLAEFLPDLPKPLRNASNPVFDEPKSFIEYFNKFKTEQSVIFCNVETSTFSAMIDYHESAVSRSWCDINARLAVQRSPEWDKWMANNGPNNKFSQSGFAEFLEDMAKDIVNPESASILEACLMLQAKKEGNFKSGLKMQDGSFEFTYDEKIVEQGSGKLTVPNQFLLEIAPFRGSEKVTVTILLRFRINDGQLRFFYKIEQPEKVEEEAFQKFFDQVTKETKVAPWYGKA